MITELGHFALILAFMVAIVQTFVPLVGAHKGWRSWMAVAEPAASAQFMLTAFAFGRLCLLISACCWLFRTATLPNQCCIKSVAHGETMRGQCCFGS